MYLAVFTVKTKFIEPDVPIGPISSMVITPEHNLAKWLDSLMKPYIPDSYSLPLTSSFIDKIKELKPTNHAKFANLAVTSLFINVPVDRVVDDIANKFFSSDLATELLFLQSKKPVMQNIFNTL